TERLRPGAAEAGSTGAGSTGAGSTGVGSTDSTGTDMAEAPSSSAGSQLAPTVHHGTDNALRPARMRMQGRLSVAGSTVGGMTQQGVRWTVDQVLALAPDEASRKAASTLGTAGPWSGTGRSGEGTVWGLCKG